VAILDVDHFKSINDTYGHAAGDTVLRELGILIRNTLRSTDTACRYGGEEFLIAFPSTTLAGTEALSERLRLTIANHVFWYEKMHIPVTVSIGVAESYPEINNAEMLLKLADKALYAAKKDGRNCVISYHYGAGL
jgi:diguanylate cyclase (GGDEF)-like protein